MFLGRTSSDKDNMNMQDEVDELDEEEFQIDESIFDVQPIASSPRPLPASYQTTMRETRPFGSSHLFQAKSPLLPTVGPSSQPVHSVKEPDDTKAEAVEEPHPYDVAMAEFEAWFESDAVVIVENMD